MIRLLCVLLSTYLVLSACAHKAPLRSPSQIIADNERKARETERETVRRERRAVKDAERARELERTSQEVSVPEGSY